MESKGRRSSKNNNSPNGVSSKHSTDDRKEDTIEYSIEVRPQNSPNLFVKSNTTTMASALPIWEASSVLTQKNDLPWSANSNGKLCYSKDVENGKGAVLFWVTENLEHEYPATLAGAAALAVIDAFDIRAACTHLIYAAQAAQLEKPWEQEFIITDRQIEDYLGLKKRTDKNRQQKLALIKEIAQQPCQITTYVSFPAQGRKKGFTISQTRLWNMLEIQHHYEADLFGDKELVGLTFRVKAGRWAKYFLNEEGCADLNTYCQIGTLSKTLVEDVMGAWQRREGATRLMIWLLFKTKADTKYALPVKTLMEIAYGAKKVEAAKSDNRLRNKLANTWDEDLLVLHEKGWQLQFHLETYSLDIQPLAFGRSNRSRPRSFFKQLLSAQMWIAPPISFKPPAVETEVDNQPVSEEKQEYYILTGSDVRAIRTKNGWTQRQRASLTGISQSLIHLIEKNQRTISTENQEILQRVLVSDRNT